jgi:D-alanyl-D-alanine carboxypeptidase-like protein/MacB-like protein
MRIVRGALALASALALLTACSTPKPATQTYGSPEDLPAFQPETRPEAAAPAIPSRPKLQANLGTNEGRPPQVTADLVRAIDGVAAVAAVGLGVVHTEAQNAEANITVLAVDPAEFRPLAPSTTSEADFVWRGLQGRQVFLAHEEYSRLGVQPGQTILLKGPAASLLFRVGGIVSNGVPNLAGAMISFDAAQALGLGTPSLLLVGLEDGQNIDKIKKALSKNLPSVRFDATAAASNRAFITGRDAEKIFGSFDYTVNPDGSIVPSADWVKKYIVGKTVPILGSTKCHKIMFPQLTGALNEINEEGLASLINVRDYGGCYNARLIRGEDPADPQSNLSMHAWGLAIDINVSTNQMGAQPTLDPRIVAIFEKWGYRWGGRWTTRPDGMHFELAAVMRDLLPKEPRRRK